MQLKTEIKIQANRPDMFVHNKKRNEIILIEVGITSQDRLQTVKAEKARKYYMLATKLGLEMNYKTRIISYVLTWDGVVTKFHRKYLIDIGLSNTTKAYSQTIVLKKMLESISLDFRCGLGSEGEFSKAPTETGAGTEPASVLAPML